MTRIKGGVMAQKRRKNILERAKGYRLGRSKKERYAHEALMRAGKYSFLNSDSGSLGITADNRCFN